MSVRSAQKSAASGKTGLSASSMASSMNSRGIDIQEAVLMPISNLILHNIPGYFAAGLITQLSYILEVYLILFYFGLDYAAAVATLEPIIFFLTNGLTLAVSRSSSEMVAQFLEAGQMTAVNTIFTYGLTTSVLFAAVGIALVVGLKGQIAEYFTPYLREEAEFYLQYVGGIGCALSCFSTSLKPYYRVESRGALEIYMEVGSAAVKLAILLTMMMFYTSRGNNEFAIPQKLSIPVISELIGQVYAFLLSMSSLMPSISKLSGLRISSTFSLELFNPFRFKVLLQILKNIIPYYLYESRWALATLPVYICFIKNESGSEFERFMIVYTYYMVRLGRLAASFIYAAEPITLAIGSINISVKRYDRVYRLALQSLIIIFALSFFFAFICFVCAPLFAERLVLANASELSEMYNSEEMKTWFEEFNFIRWGFIEGLSLAPLEICCSVAIFRNEPWKLAFYSFAWIVINTLLCIFLVIQEGINQPLEESLYFSDLAMLIFEIPTVVAVLISLTKLSSQSVAKSDGDYSELEDQFNTNVADGKNSDNLIRPVESQLEANSSTFYRNESIAQPNNSLNAQSGLVTSLMESKPESQVKSSSQIGNDTSSNLRTDD